MHSSIKIDKVNYIKIILSNWKNNQKIYRWLNPISNHLLYALSGVNQIVYVCSNFKSFSILDQAMTLAHEIQHLIQRCNAFTFSPEGFTKNPVIQRVFNSLNQGVPLESGNLYWGLLIGKIGIKDKGMKRLFGKACLTENFWKNLSPDIPIIAPELIQEDDLDGCSDIPFSFKKHYWKVRGRF